MKRYGNLYEKIISFENLLIAAKKASAGKKRKNDVAEFQFFLEPRIIDLERELREGTYKPGPYRQFRIFEPKPRNICCSPFRDRVVHHAICGVIELIFEKKLIHDTYACRNGKGAHIAIKRCQEFTRRYSYFLKCDIRKYFESIDHEQLKCILRRIFKDQKLLSLLEIIINHQPPNYKAGVGLPIGNLTSQHFANLYLGELDRYLKERICVPGFLRYMDDFICFADSKAELFNALDEIRYFCSTKLKLELKEKVTLVAPVTEGVPFLGFRVFRNLVRLQRQNLVRLRKKKKQLEKQFLIGEITEDELILSIQSMVGHVLHADTTLVRRQLFSSSLKLA